MKAQKGDLIRIVNVMDYEFDPYKVGDILEVVDRRNEYDVYAYYGGVKTVVSDCEYVIHRKSGEEVDAAPTATYVTEGTDVLVEEPVNAEPIAQDAVNHPNHYTQGRFETIEIIEEITQGYGDGYVAYCVGNALKYLARAPYKHAEPTEDLAKAAKYLEFAIGRLTQDERNTIE